MSQLSAARLAEFEFVQKELDVMAIDAVDWRERASPDFGIRSAEALRGFIEARHELAQQARAMIEGELGF
jgi:hypothetical protein